MLLRVLSTCLTLMTAPSSSPGNQEERRTFTITPDSPELWPQGCEEAVSEGSSQEKGEDSEIRKQQLRLPRNQRAAEELELAPVGVDWLSLNVVPLASVSKARRGQDICPRTSV